jgi:hypothetical protein
MTDELKPCPFCGARGVEYHTDSGKILAGCDAECKGFGFPVEPYIWNHRPIEDKLEAENARLKDNNAKLCIMSGLDVDVEFQPWEVIIRKLQCEMDDLRATLHLLPEPPEVKP